MKKFAVIVAGGSGTRLGGEIPKQFQNLCGRPVLWWSLKAFHDQDPETRLILVLPKDFKTLWNDLNSSLPENDKFPFKIAEGGSSRSESVRKGLALVDEEDSLVAVHDAARPLVTVEVIERGWKCAFESGACVPVVPVSDSLRYLTEKGSECVDRSDFVAVQTPQVFKTELLKQAYNNAGDNSFSDDAAVVENYGFPVAIYKGHEYNIKVTNPKDIEIATLLMDKNV